MKKVFNVTAEDKFKTLLSSDSEFNVFAENITEAIGKISKVMSEKQRISEAKLLCKVEEDSDLLRYAEE